MRMQDTTHIWLNKTFDETMQLLEEAKHYNQYLIRRQVRHLMPLDRLELTAESLRVTSRLSHTMSWLMAEKAILNEELNRQEAEELFEPLHTEMTCLRNNNHATAICPDGLQSLLDRSRELFMRACRLEDMLREQYRETLLV